MKRALQSLLLFAAFYTAVCGAVEDPAFDRESFGEFKAVKILPTDGMTVVVTKTGKLYVTSKNGRFAVVGGELIDVWSNKKILGENDLPVVDTLPLQRLRATGLKPEALASIRYGEGTNHFTLFVTTSDKWSLKALNEIERVKTDYVFDIVFVPSTEEEAMRIAGQLCAEKTPGTIMQTLLSEEQLPKTSFGCMKPMIAKTAIAVELLGIKLTPTIVADNGDVQIGYKKGVLEFLKEHSR